jgi:hydroxymethylpyrimidine/phosphomethylpyrimidine kinase
MSSLPVVLCFGASDATGAADLQADYLAVSSMGCHPATVVTAIAISDGDAERTLVPLDEETIEGQAQAVLQNMAVAAFKVGAIASADQVQSIAEMLADFDSVPVVLEPKIAPAAGDEANGELAVAVRELLVPQSTVVCISLPLARRLVSLANDDDERSHELPAATCARELIDWGAEFVLVTDSEPGSAQATAALYDESGLVRSESLPRTELPSARLLGAMDTLSAALAGLLAQGLDIPEACQEASQYTAAAVMHAFQAGIGVTIPDRLFWAGDDDDEADDDDGADIN